MPEETTPKINFEQTYCPKCYGQFNHCGTCPADGTELRGAHNDPLVGKVFAERYEIQGLVGMGGMSLVYRAKHRLMDRTVAIKTLHGNIRNDHLSLERFRLEAQAASSLSHQNIIAVYDFGVTPEGEAFFVMDYLDGESLGDLLERKGKIPYDRAVPIFRQICDGLGAAHKKSIVHRDLKPDNVILLKQDDGTELVKLVDFGIAKLLPGSGKDQQHLTKTGEVFGSPIYMSPEQCLGRDLDQRSDIYALGCLMYEALSGDPPLLGESFLETMNKHVGEDPRPLAEVAPDIKVSPELEQIIFTCLQKDPTKRFQSAEEIRDQLGALPIASTSQSTMSRPLTTLSTTAAPCPQTQKRTVWKILGGTCAALLFILIGIVTLWNGPAEDQGTPLNKMRWQLAMGTGESEISNKQFDQAEIAFNNAESIARAFKDGKARLEATLKEKAVLYNAWEGHAELLEKTNDEITSILLERLKKEFQQQLQTIDQIGKVPMDSSVAAANAKLRADAQVSSIVATANKLYGAKMFLEMTDLLSKAISTNRKLLGEDSMSIAKLESVNADALIALSRFNEVRPVLLHSCKVRKAQVSTNPNDYLRALNKLAKFDLDQNDMTAAKPELEEALKLSEQKGITKEFHVLALRNYANLLHQTNKEAESKEYLKKADALER